MPKVVFVNHERVIGAKEGDTILETALAHGFEIPSDCGGNAVCGTCHVYIEKGMENLSPLSEDEIELLLDCDNRRENSRLACQCAIKGDIAVKIPD